jgi:hypothetical protein
MIRTLVLICLIAFACRAAQAVEYSFSIQDHLDHTWTNELVHYDITAAPGEFRPGSAQLRDENGHTLPVQLANVSTHPDGSVKTAEVWFIVSVPAGEKRAFVLTGGRQESAPQPAADDLSAKIENGSAVLSDSKIAVRVLNGEKKWDTPQAASQLPAPLQGVRLPSGVWTGRGWFETAHRATGYSARLTDDGPVFKRAVIEYSFARPAGWSREHDPFYRMTVQLVAGQPLATITEEFNLGDPKVYQPPHFDSEKQEMLWDWWSWRPHEAQDNFVFSLYDGWHPTHARVISPSVTSPEKGKVDSGHESEYALPYGQEGKEHFEFSLTPWANWEPDSSSIYTLYKPADSASDILSILPFAPGRWRNPDMLPHEPSFIHQHTSTSSLRVYSTSKPDLFVRAPLHLGRREWAIAALRNPSVVDEKTVDTPIAALSRKLSWSLDKIKDWTLSWKTTAQYPHLFVKAGDLAGLRARIKSSPVLEAALRKESYIAVHRYLLDGKPDDLAKAYDEVLATLNGKIRDVFAWQGGERVSINTFPWHLQTCAAQADVVLADPALTAEQRDALLARFAFLSYVLRDDDFLPPRKAGFGWGSANMPVNVGGARAMLAALLSDHPRTADWIENSKKYFTYVVEQYYGKDGSPYSCPHYMITEGGPVATTLLALQNTGRLGDIRTTFPALHAYGRFLVDMTTPQDVRFGQRLLPISGDSYWEGNPLAGQFAPLFKTDDPALASALMWTWQQSGAPLSGFTNAAFFLDPTIPARAPQVKSAAYPGYGAFLRNGFDTAQESYIQIRFGNFTIDHTHDDAGSLHWYARGVPLALNFAPMYTPFIEDPWWYSTLSYNHHEYDQPVPCPGDGKPGNPDCFYTGKAWYDHRFEPNTALAPVADQVAADSSITEMHGTLDAFVSTPGADYARGSAKREWFEIRPYFYKDRGLPEPWTPNTVFDKVHLKQPFLWTRHFIWVKDENPDGPQYLIITDDLSGNHELEPAFNFWCLADSVKAVGARQYAFSGQHGLDLDMFVLEPQQGRVQTGEWSHTQAFLKSTEEKQEFVRVYGSKNGGGFHVVLFPRKPNEPQPKVETLQGGKVVKISLPDQTHWIVLSPQPVTIRDGKMKFTGTAGVVKKWKDGRTQVYRFDEKGKR